MPIRINVNVTSPEIKVGSFSNPQRVLGKKSIEVSEEFRFLEGATLDINQYQSALRAPIENRGYGIAGSKILGSIQDKNNINEIGLDYRSRLRRLPGGVDPLRQMRLEYGNRTGPNASNFKPVENPSAATNDAIRAQRESGFAQSKAALEAAVGAPALFKVIGGVAKGGISGLSYVAGQSGLISKQAAETGLTAIASAGFLGWYGYETTQGRGAMTIPNWLMGNRPEAERGKEFGNALDLMSEAIIGAELTGRVIAGGYKGIQYMAGLFARTSPKSSGWQFQQRLEGYSNSPFSQGGGLPGPSTPTMTPKSSNPNFGSSGSKGVYEFGEGEGDIVEGILRPFGGSLGYNPPSNLTGGTVPRKSQGARPGGLRAIEFDLRTMEKLLDASGINYTGSRDQLSGLIRSIGYGSETREGAKQIAESIARLETLTKGTPEYNQLADEITEGLNSLASQRMGVGNNEKKWGGTKFERADEGVYEEPQFKDLKNPDEPTPQPQPQRSPQEKRNDTGPTFKERPDKIPVILEEVTKGEIVPANKPNQEIIPAQKPRLPVVEVNPEINPNNKGLAEVKPKMDPLPDPKPDPEFDPFVWVNPWAWIKKIDPIVPVKTEFKEPPPKKPTGGGKLDLPSMQEWQGPTLSPVRGGSLPIAPAFYKSSFNIPAYIIGSGRLEYADN